MKDENAQRNPSKGPNQQKDLTNNPDYSSANHPADIRDSRAEDGSSDGVANKTTGSGGNTGGNGGRIGENTNSDNTEGQRGGGESRNKDLRTPSAQGEHGAHKTKGQGGGNGGREGSFSGGKS